VGARRIFDILATLGFALAALSQTGGDSTRFKVASIQLAKPAVPGQVSGCIGTMCGGPRTNDPAFSYLQVPLMSVLEWASGKPAFQIFGPSWLTARDSPRFDVVATVPPGTTDEQFEVMLQNLMVDRLGLKVHHETRKLPVNTLTVSEGGPKLKEMPKTNPSGDLQGRSRNHQFTLSANGVVPVATLVVSLKHSLNEEVVDKTGLTGMYTFSLEWSDAPAVGGAPQLPSLAAALEQGLGLKLARGEQDFDVLVVDHVENAPTGN
jgi:uncharacterized protein (TIGR03435 family)